MTIVTAPPFRLDTVLTHLHRERTYQPAATFAELFADALLSGLKTAMDSRTVPLTKASIAAAVEDAERTARKLADATICTSCGHPFADHLTSRGRGRGTGCLECACTERRPRPEHRTHAPATAGGSR